METATLTLSITPSTVLVVDDHALIRAAISHMLTSQPAIKRVIMAQSYAEAEQQAAQLYPEVIWLDLHIAHFDSSTEIDRLKKLSPNSRIMALADVEDEQEAFAAIMAGAQGYRSKEDIDPEEIITIIQRLCRGEFVLQPVLLAHVMQRLRTAVLPLSGSENELSTRVLLHLTERNRLAQLTIREREVLQFIGHGFRDRDIAQGLHITQKTVQKHVQRILSKLGAQNRTEAAYFIHRKVVS